MPAGVRLRQIARVGTALVAAAIASATDARATDAVLYRIFLHDGTPVVSYGDYARVGDRVVFSMPVGPLSDLPTLQLVTLPASAVDWPATERYAESARYAHYVATRAESDFALMSAEVARVLNTIALTPDPAARLEMAERARRTMVEWPQHNFGYRAAELRQMVGLLDEIISELAASLGRGAFDLSFVSLSAVQPPAEPVLPLPTLRESVQQVLSVARLSESPAERLSLLQAGLVMLDEDPAAGDAADSAGDAWADSTRRLIRLSIAAEVGVDRAYADLAKRVLARATARAAAADVRGVERLLDEVRRRDDKLGRQRPDATAALLAAVGSRLDAARRLRLAYDRWALRRPLVSAYRRQTRSAVTGLSAARPLLEDIRALAGPAPAALDGLEATVIRSIRRLEGVVPPDELREAHSLLTSAFRFAGNAVSLRRRAVEAGDLGAAWDASSAAAAAMILIGRVETAIKRLQKPPAPDSP